MISILNHLTVEEILNMCDSGILECSHYYVEDGQIKLSKDAIIDMIHSLI